MDISRHYANSIILGRTPDVYTSFTYLFAHLHESLFISISAASINHTQSALAVLNLMLPIAFYVMAKPYLHKIDSRLPALATAFWAIFTNGFGGFAWIYFTELKIFAPGQTQIQLLLETADKTYNGTLYGILGLWHVPATLSLVLLFVAIFLISKSEISHKKFVILFSIIISVLYLTHVTFAVVLVLFISLFNILFKNQTLRLYDSLKASLIGYFIVISVYFILILFNTRFSLNTSLLLSIFLPISAATISILLRKYIDKGLSTNYLLKKIKNKIPSIKKIILGLMLIYAIAFFSWFSLSDSFSTSQVFASM